MKGYSEALEQRLEVTEILLLKLLHTTNEEIVSSAVQECQISGLSRTKTGQSTSQKDMGPTEARKATLMSHWEKFPLKTYEDVKRWKEDALQPLEAPSKRPVQSNQSNQYIPEPQHFSRSQLYQQSEQISTSPCLPPDKVNHRTTALRTREPRGRMEITDLGSVWNEDSSDACIQGAPIETESARPSSSSTLQMTEEEPGTSFELPEEFRKQFLW